MQKALLGAALALAGITQAQAFDRALSGLWYNPAQSGHGFEVTAIDADTVSVAWYTYNRNGAPIWISALLDESPAGVLSGNASYIDGIRFGEFSSAGRQLKPWGTLKLTFTDCDTGSVDYNGTLILPANCQRADRQLPAELTTLGRETDHYRQSTDHRWRGAVNFVCGLPPAFEQAFL